MIWNFGRIFNPRIIDIKSTIKSTLLDTVFQLTKTIETKTYF